MTPDLLALAIITAGDIIVDILVPVDEQPEEFKAQVRAKLQENADENEAWLKAEIQRLKGQ